MKKEVPKRPSRGRPQLTEKQITAVRDRISDCALRLFQEEGYDAVSMRRLAQEANITTMTLYKYFDNKIDILRVLWANVFVDLFDELDQIAAAVAEPLPRFHAVALGYVEYWLENRQHYFMVFMSKGISQTDVSGFFQDDTTVQRFDLLRDCLAATIYKELAADAVRVKFELLMCVLNGIAHNLITISSYPWSNVEDLVRTAIDGLVET